MTIRSSSLTGNRVKTSRTSGFWNAIDGVYDFDDVEEDTRNIEVQRLSHSLNGASASQSGPSKLKKLAVPVPLKPATKPDSSIFGSAKKPSLSARLGNSLNSSFSRMQGKRSLPTANANSASNGTLPINEDGEAEGAQYATYHARANKGVASLKNGIGNTPITGRGRKKSAISGRGAGVECSGEGDAGYISRSPSPPSPEIRPPSGLGRIDARADLSPAALIAEARANWPSGGLGCAVEAGNLASSLVSSECYVLTFAQIIRH